MEPRIIDVPNETQTKVSRYTKEGKKITYELNILQQPDKARACGSGARASADRRPVDPPPIVELLIFEGENADKEITLQMSANYFLFATLESARPIAHGRVPQDAHRPPVLTGTPVAGMVYLERPRPAGYFIFPDLSVRHEGVYRLSFNLYEELKEDKDEDRLDEDKDSIKARGLGDAHVTQRLEVKSAPFTVWSAKKFPGLGTSTPLSRTVAEQGCRVRIRRDVRMRRRDQKDGKEHWTGYDNEPPRTPDAYNQQHYPQQQSGQKSGSPSSPVSLAPATASRRSSGEHLSQPYQQPVYPPVAAPQYGYAQPAYGAPPAHHYPAQYPTHATLPPPVLQPTMPSNQLAPQPHSFATSAQTPQQYSGYPPGAHSHEVNIQPRHSMGDQGQHYNHEQRRSSLQAPPQAGYQGQYARHDSVAYGVAQHAPPNTMEPPQQPNYKRAGPTLPPLNTSFPLSGLLEPSPTSAGPVSHYVNYSRPSETAQGVPPPPAPYTPTSETYPTKRSYDTSFNPHRYHETLRHGARPSNEEEPNGTYTEYGSGTSMAYPRADGSISQRAYNYR